MQNALPTTVPGEYASIPSAEIFPTAFAVLGLTFAGTKVTAAYPASQKITAKTVLRLQEGRQSAAAAIVLFWENLVLLIAVVQASV